MRVGWCSTSLHVTVPGRKQKLREPLASAGIGVVRGNSRSPIHGTAMTSIPIGTSQAVPCIREVDDGSRTTKTVSKICSVHQALRRATWAQYALIDRLLLQVDLSLLKDYQLLLKIYLSAHRMGEREWRFEDRADFSEMLACLHADLEDLGEPRHMLQPPRYLPANDCDGLGVAYVIRSLRGGTAMLRSRLHCEAPSQYLDHKPALAWPEFLLQLESAAERAGGIEEASRAARRTFDTLIVEFALGLSPAANFQ
jgi:heme oxygenase